MSISRATSPSRSLWNRSTGSRKNAGKRQIKLWTEKRGLTAFIQTGGWNAVGYVSQLSEQDVAAIAKGPEQRELIRSIAAKQGTRNVRVLGSLVRGEADSNRALDLLVDLGNHLSP